MTPCAVAGFGHAVQARPLPARWLETVTDPRAIVLKDFYDNEGRTTKTIEAYTDGTPTNNTNKTTEYTYDGDNNLLTLQADEQGGAFQRTAWVYGVTTTGGSDINSNDLAAAMQYPDKTTGLPSSSEQESYSVNELGQQKTVTDRNGSVHTYSFDVLGRQTADAVTTLASGVDGAVRRLEVAYDTGGRPYLYTSYNAASAGSIVNQVQDVYNGLGQLTKEYQSHSGAVNPSTTPNVQYAYSEMAGGANHSRPISITYPNGRGLTYSYNTGLDTTISRLSAIVDGSTTLEAYTYLGLDTTVKRAHPQPGVDLTYLKQTGEANGDAGDPYTGLDRFGRVVDQRWIVTANGTHTDRFQYAYDRDGNRLYRSNLVNHAFDELYHANGASNGYDPLNQLTAFARGTLSDTNADGVPDTVASASRSQSWTLDALGNWSSLSTNGTAVNRTHNQQNETTAVGTSNLAFDHNGNTTTDDLNHTLSYDAWNRAVRVQSGSTTLASYAFDALGRRIVETSSGTTRDLYFSSDWQVLEERVAGTAKTQYVWSPVYVDALIERDRDADGNTGNGLEERLYAQQDANYNVTAFINTSGSVVERYVYDPYGAVTFLTAAWGTLSASAYAAIYLHQGGRYESATGLYHFRYRDYSPSLGRWVQVDPIGFTGGDADLYRSEGNAPTEAVDPSGLSWLSLLLLQNALEWGAGFGTDLWYGSQIVESRRRFDPHATYERGRPLDLIVPPGQTYGEQGKGLLTISEQLEMKAGLRHVADLTQTAVVWNTTGPGFATPGGNPGRFFLPKGKPPNLDAMSEAAAKPVKPGSSFSRAGSSYQSHAIRPDWLGPKPCGNVASINAQAQALLTAAQIAQPLLASRDGESTARSDCQGMATVSGPQVGPLGLAGSRYCRGPGGEQGDRQSVAFDRESERPGGVA